MPPRTEAIALEVGADSRADPGRWARLLDCGLILAALGGLLALAWFVLAAVVGLGLVTFATGSMAPRYPVGSIAVSAAVPLSQVHPGDVVTVDRGAGVLPITHRVVSYRLERGVAVMRLKGDANSTPDPVVYRVSRLRRIIAPLPGSADWVRFASSPLGVGVIAMLVAGAAVWALWPHAGGGRRA